MVLCTYVHICVVGSAAGHALVCDAAPWLCAWVSVRDFRGYLSCSYCRLEGRLSVSIIRQGAGLSISAPLLPLLLPEYSRL